MMLVRPDGSGRAVRDVLLDAALWVEQQVSPAPTTARRYGEGTRREVTVTLDADEEVTVAVGRTAPSGWTQDERITLSAEQARWLVQTLVAHPTALGSPPYLHIDEPESRIDLVLRRLRQLWTTRPDSRLGQLVAEAVWSMDPAALSHPPGPGDSGSDRTLSASLDTLYDTEDDELLRAATVAIDMAVDSGARPDHPAARRDDGATPQDL